ncbi:hypothetical protein Agabi119p4_8568 [Agaricus bisporus var. burnettii]|uniref:Uncharacterized protein n=1 Tax=Agaricus bisporus var. burnettii TaxID=192524 RepID=A0A8H7C6A6_AGABI|nr:hypothetical protein Agabi119p4_8568 [Agaricus bisporus var. burnettii]
MIMFESAVLDRSHLILAPDRSLRGKGYIRPITSKFEDDLRAFRPASRPILFDWYLAVSSPCHSGGQLPSLIHWSGKVNY